MQLSTNGIDLIVEFEGLKLIPYNDPRNYATVGIGHLIRKGPVLPTDQPITKEQAYILFKADSTWAQTAVSNLVKVPLTQNQFDALVSFTYNLGAGTLEHSVLLSVLNTGNYQAVPDHMLSYIKAGGKVLPGLVKRRAAEAALFTSL